MKQNKTLMIVVVPERPAMVTRLAVHDVTLSARYATYRPVPTVTNTSVQITRVEALKTLIQRHPSLQSQNISKSI